MEPISAHRSASELFLAHGRDFQRNRYVYPVLSRRAQGVSIGVNLNPDKRCNFDCAYCQVDRSLGNSRGNEPPGVELDLLAEELRAMLDLVTSGRLFTETHFRDTPGHLRRLNDIALSGDGEPTLCPQFGEAVEICAERRRRLGLEDLKLVLITNASLLDQARLQPALAALDANHGEIWAKLDAGTETYYRQISRSHVSFERILKNLRAAARVRPIVIQSLFLRARGDPPSEGEIDAYCERLCEIATAPGQIKLVQIHTVARPPAEGWITPLGADQLGAIAEVVRRRTGLAVETYA